MLYRKKPFGIPAVINNQVMEYGTIVEVTEIVEMYEDGKMDIRTKGIKVFRILEVIKQVPNKLFSGAIVTYLDNNNKSNKKLMLRIMSSIAGLHKLLNITFFS